MSKHRPKRPLRDAQGRFMRRETIGLHGQRLDEPYGETGVYLNYEQSWLAFNWRVLEEALEPGRHPLLERVKFLAISANNLDEFFQKRVGALKRQVAARALHPSVDGLRPPETLALVRENVLRMTKVMHGLLQRELWPGLTDAGIHVHGYGDLGRRERNWADAWFAEQLFPILTPLAVDPGHPFPFISNLSLSLAVELQDRHGEWHFARVKIPTERGRFLRIPDEHREQPGNGVLLLPVEQLVAANAHSLFTGMKVLSVASFRVSRSAEVEEPDIETDDLLELIAEELRHRKYAPVVRLQVDKELSPQLRELLCDELDIGSEEVYVGERLLGLADLMEIAQLPIAAHLKYPNWSPRPHPQIHRASPGDGGAPDMFELLRQGDLLVHHPYQSFETSVVEFIRQAARDPKVRAIKQTLYRTSQDSEIMRALIAAAAAGKQVAVLVELQARFDEQRNIELAHRLEEAGVHVAYGVVGLKTHSKTTLVVREEEGGLRRYVHIGTGNYNPDTARVYEDFGLLSSDPELGEDLSRLFNYLTGFAPGQTYGRILVAPGTFRRQMLRLIDVEIGEATRGRPARIVAKMNNLEDPLVIQRLYQASQAGVEVDLIVRSVCRLVPGRPGLSERIRVRSIVGRMLEHSRLYWFHHHGTEKVYMGSGDWMRRNLDRRVEVLAPIDQPALRAYLRHYLDLALADVRQAWVLGPDGEWSALRRTVGDGPSSQEAMMQLAETGRPPVAWQPRTVDARKRIVAKS